MNRHKLIKIEDLYDRAISKMKYCDELEKALDKACKLLFEEMATVEKDGKRVFMKSVEEWKAWALDESN